MTNTDLIITQEHPLFDQVHWVCKARCLDTTYRPTTRLYVDLNLIMATDEHRVHISRSKYNWTPGLYQISTYTKTRIVLEGPGPDLNYPDVATIWPSSCTIVPLSGCTIPVALARIIRALPDNYAIDYHLVDDMMRDQKFFAANVSADGVSFTNTSGNQSGLIATIQPYNVGK